MIDAEEFLELNGKDALRVRIIIILHAIKI
jgi:hypothetical protein